VRHRPWLAWLLGIVLIIPFVVACSGTREPTPTPAPVSSEGAAAPTQSASLPTPSMSPLETPEPSGDAVPATAAPSPSALPQPSLERWAAAWQAVESYVVELTATDANGNVLYTFEVWHEAPDRSRVVGTLPGDQELEVIAIGDRAWVRISGLGNWMEVPRTQVSTFTGGATIDEDFYSERALGSPGDLPPYEYLGTELLDGELTHVWRATFPEYGNGTLTIWIAEDDLPRRLHWESTEGSLDYRYRRINEPLGIEPPTS